MEKPVTIVGAGRAGTRARRFTEIRIAAEQPSPALVITGGNDVRVRDLSLTSGGIRYGGDADPCRGIDGPISEGQLDIADVAIVGSLVTGVHFNGRSLVMRDLEVRSGAEAGVYVAGAQSDIVMEDFDAAFNAGWGLYLCNRVGSGLIFLNGGSLHFNGRGGLAIVGGGGPAPAKRPACIQNILAFGNARFGILLFDVAVETLLFDVFAGATATDANGSWGDGIAVGSSTQVVLWDVKSWNNSRAGVSAFDCLPSEPTEVLVVGDVSLADNPIDLNYEHVCGASSSILFQPAVNGALINACGSQFLAPPADAHCLAGGVEHPCQAKSSSLVPPDFDP